MKVFGHGSYIGTTGYNNHTRDFFRELNKHLDLKFRNFTVAPNWDGYSDEPHDNQKYLTDEDRTILHYQTLLDNNNTRKDYKIYSNYGDDFEEDFNLVLNETNHHYFYDNYDKPSIAYNVWESTLQPQSFFEKLKEFDELWVPSKWQKECTIKQGYDENKIKVVPEGVDIHTFFPEEVDLLKDYKDGRFKFLLFGRWDYRKSTKEIIETFLSTFKSDEPVDLIVSIDNMWGKNLDGIETTEERLEFYGLVDDRIKIIHFPKREDYIKYLKTGHVFLSCARSEGWNLPLIEAMSCGTPSIYSDCSGQLEFAQGKGIPIRIVGEKPANVNTYARYTMSDLPGNYYEPDFNHLSEMMRKVYENYNHYKNKAVLESKEIRNNFSWEQIGKIGYETCLEFYKKINSDSYIKNLPNNKINVTYINGPRVDINGPRKKDYLIEFIDSKNNIIHKSKITNNMWTTCGRKYYEEWKIKINNEVFDTFNLENKKVLISLESKSIGDTIAWAPYSVEFAKKHNCKVVLSTFHNEWFKNLDTYKDIDFIEPGMSTNCYTSYKIGWFRSDENKWNKFDMYPNQVNLIPLQQTATDILGLEYKEVNHGIDFPKGEKPMEKEYVVFGPNATAGCKEWTYENWVSLSKLIKELGYEVVTLTQQPYHIDGVINVWGEPLDVVCNYLHNAKTFIGLGSGLSWINWALNKYTYMINGFVEEGHEFTSNMTKITNNICIKCWNDPVHVFDAGDWDWCPVYKGTERQHICQKSITPLQVFNTLNI